MRDGGIRDDGSPEPTTEKVTGTTRKCANCGQVGHIKTNKKYVCPCSQKETAALGEAEASNRLPPGPDKPRKSSKRDNWRPTQDPRVGDKFWDPRCWEAGAFENKMEAPRPPKGKQKQVTWEDAENWGFGEE
jgi:transcription initiation factor TFIID subunit 1, fungi type